MKFLFNIHKFARRKRERTVPVSVASLFLCVITVAVLFMYQAPITQATIPKIINFQGKLTNKTGAVGTNVADGTYAMQFRLADAPSAGTVWWTETWDQPSGSCAKIQVTNGVFNVPLGSCNSLSGVDFTTGVWYLGINVNITGSYDGEMSPRKQLLASSYAFVANGVSGDGPVNSTLSSATALTVAKASTNYALQVDTSAASAVTGLKVTSAAAASGLALTVISSGTNENITLDAKGTGTISLGATSTGDILLGGGSGSTGCTVTNSTGAFACTAGGSFTTLALTGAVTGATSYNGLVVTANTGVITTGTWNGTTIAIANGGTNAVTSQAAINNLSQLTTTGDLLYYDGANSTRFPRGSNTQCLTSNTTTIVWGACGTGGARLDQITAATGTNTIANANFAQVWNWGTLTTQTGMTFGGGTAMTTGALFNLNGGTYVHTTAETGSLVPVTFTDASTNTTGATTTNGLNLTATLNTSGAGTKTINGINLNAPTLTACTSGACTYNGINVTGGSISNVTSSALNVSAGTGAGTNYAAIFQGGNVGIGIASPLTLLDVARSSGSGLQNMLRLEVPSACSNGSRMYFTGGNVTLGAIDVVDECATSDDTSLRFSTWHGGLGETMRIYGRTVGINVTAPGAVLDLDLANASSITAEKILFRSQNTAQTLTDGTTIASWRNNQFLAPTLNGVAAGGTETVTTAATLYVDAAPSGSNITITNPYSIFSDNGAVRFDNESLGTTSTDGLALINNTAAAAGSQQYSPRLRFTGQGWKTDATAASQTVDFIQQVIPVQGTANPTAYLDISSQVNGGGYTNKLAITSAGNVGIGTTGPDRKLDILDASNPQLRLSQADGSAYTDLQTNSSGYLFISPSGNRVALGNASGTSAPSTDLHLRTSSGRGLAVEDDTTGAFITLAAPDGQLNRILFSKGPAGGPGFTQRGTIDYLLDATAANQYMSFRVGNGTEQVRITGDGNVGIGDASPAALLTVGNGDLFQVNSSGNLTFNQTAPTVSIGNTGSLVFNDGTNTLCTIADAGTTGNLTCTGNITGSSTGTVGYWSRSGTTLSPATANDILSVPYAATGVTTNNIKVANIANTGTFDTTAGDLTNYGGYFSNTATRSAGANALTNVGLYATASGAQNNYAAIFDQGNVGIGTANPDAGLTVYQKSVKVASATTRYTTLDGDSISIYEPWVPDYAFTAGASGITTVGTVTATGGLVANSITNIGGGTTLNITNWAGVNIVPGSGGSSTALVVAQSGSNYGLQVDESTASAVTGIKIKAAAAGGGIALSAISSGTDENLTLDAKGAGTVSIGPTSTGDILLGGGSGSTGCTLTNSTGALACTAGGSFTTMALTGAITGAASYNGLVITANTGVITTGTWNGTAIGVANGGTNITSYTTGDLLYASGATTLSKRAAVAVGSIFVSNGVGAAPVWSNTPSIIPTGGGNVQITNTTAQNTAGILDLEATSSTDFIPNLYVNTIQTSTGSLTASYGIENNISSSAVVTGAGVGQKLYGIYNSVTKTGADTATGMYNTYGIYNLLTNIGRTNVGTVNTYGGYFDSFGDTAGTSTTYGVYTTAAGADTNYALYSAAGTNYFAGNVGIGDTSPAALLTVGNGDLVQVTSAGKIIQAPTNFTASGGDIGLSQTITITGTSDGADYYGHKISVINNQTVNPDIAYGQFISFTDSGSLANSVYGLYVDATTANSSDTTYAAIFQGGNVGIGTTSPVDPFSIGTAINASATHALFNLSNTALSSGSGSGTYIGANPASFSGDFLKLQVANTTKATLTSAGALTLASSLTANAASTINGSLTVNGANTVTDSFGNLGVYSTDAFAVDKGGQISLNGKYNTAGSMVNLGTIAGRKENATDGNGNGYLAFGTTTGTTNTEKMRVTSAGQLLIGATTFYGANSQTLETNTSGALGGIDMNGWNATAGANTGQDLTFTRSRSSTIGTKTVVASGDDLGQIIWRGVESGGAFSNAASIRAIVDGTVGSFTVPTRLETHVFNTSGTDVTAMTILNSGNVGIGTTGPAEKLHVTGGNILQTVTTSPTVKGSVNDATNLNGPLGIYVSGKYAYIPAFTGNRFTIVDISNPASPAVIGSVNDATNLNNAYKTVVSGKYAYVTSYTGNRLTVVDVSNPKAPSVTGSLNDATNLSTPEGLYVSGKYVYVASSNSRLTVVDVSNPAAPVVVGSLSDATNLGIPVSIYVQGKYAYVTTYSANRLTIVNISNPASPTVVGSVQDATNLAQSWDVYVSGRYAYVTAFAGARLTVVDVSDPTTPVVVGNVNDATNLNGPRELSVSGRYAYVSVGTGNRLTVVDISTPASPTVAGSLNDATNLSGARGIFVSGKYAYVSALGGNRLTVVDINGIEAPSASIGNTSSQDLTVTENADIGNNLYVRNGLNVGTGGIQGNGPLTLQGLGTTSATATIDARNSAGTSLFYVRDDGNVGIGTTGPNETLEISAAAGAKFGMSDPSLAHGVTDFVPTSEFFHINQGANDVGGAVLWGVSSSVGQRPMVLNGTFGNTDPTDTVPAILLQGVKRSGTSVTNLGALETVLQVTGLVGSGNDYLTILGSGNVGIGTTAPASILTVQTTGADAAGEKYLRVKNTSSFTGIALDPGQAGDVDWIILAGYPNAGDFNIRESGVANYLTIKKTTGNVGIGDTTPAALFTVGNTDLFQVNSSGRVLLPAGASGAGNLALSTTGDTNTGLYFSAADTIKVQTGGTDRVTIDASGRVTIASAASVGLDVQMNSAAANQFLRLTNTESGGKAWEWDVIGTSSNLQLRNATDSVLALQLTPATGAISTILSGTASTNAVCSSLANATAPTAGTLYEIRDCNAAPAADYAEDYPVAPDVSYGDVVVTGSQMVNTYDETNGNIDWTKVKGQITQMVKSTGAYQANMIGIVSDNHGDFTSAGHNIKTEDHPMPVALNGRVPVKVTNENGAIMSGDFLTSSERFPGYAMLATHSGQIIGQALESFNSSTPDSLGRIMVFIKVGFQSIGNTIVLDAPQAVDSSNQASVQGTTQTGSLASANSSSTFIIKQQTSTTTSSNAASDILQLQSGDANRLMVASTGSVILNGNLTSGAVLTVKNNNDSLFIINTTGTAIFYGTLVIKKDIVALGSILGSTAVLARNVDSETIHQGDLVMLVGAEPDNFGGEVPIDQIKKAVAGSGTVLGVADKNYNALVAEINNSTASGGKDIAPNDYLNVVMSGNFKVINVDATTAAIAVGDRLTVSNTPGMARKWEATDAVSSIGIALDSLPSGTGSVRVLLLFGAPASVASASTDTTPAVSDPSSTSTSTDPSATQSTASSTVDPTTSSDTNTVGTVSQPPSQDTLPVSSAPPTSTDSATP